MTAACFPHSFQLSRSDNRHRMTLCESQSNRALVRYAGLSDHVIEDHGLFTPTTQAARTCQSHRCPLRGAVPPTMECWQSEHASAAFLRACAGIGQPPSTQSGQLHARVAEAPLTFSDRKTRALKTARERASLRPVTEARRGVASLSGAISHKSAGG
jgi:hypothetical protein